jgi:hypothetical protein
MAEEGTLDELRALGHQPMTPMQAIRAHCIDCAGGSASEVAKCAARKCPSWPFRFGHNPWRPPLSEARLAALQEAAYATLTSQLHAYFETGQAPRHS